MLFAVIALSVVLIVVLTAVFKVHPFLSLLLGAFFVGIASGMPLLTVVENVNDGFGGLMKALELSLLPEQSLVLF